MKTQLSKIMSTAWKFTKTTGLSFAECLKKAWANFKLIQKMQSGIVRFYFQKVNGEIREAWGSLEEKYFDGQTKGSEKAKNDTVQVYFDTEAQEIRCFKKFNLINVA